MMDAVHKARDPHKIQTLSFQKVALATYLESPKACALRTARRRLGTVRMTTVKLTAYAP